MTEYEGKLVNRDYKIAIVASHFNEFVVTRLVQGAKNTLKQYGFSDEDIDLAWCPGAFEIPLLAQKLVQTGRYDALICLGAVIRGETSHYDYVCNAVQSGISRLNLDSGVPVLFGVLMTDTIEQAIARSGSKAGNEGSSCASAALQMVNVLREIQD